MRLWWWEWELLRLHEGRRTSPWSVKHASGERDYPRVFDGLERTICRRRHHAEITFPKDEAEFPLPEVPCPRFLDRRS